MFSGISYHECILFLVALSWNTRAAQVDAFNACMPTLCIAAAEFSGYIYDHKYTEIGILLKVCDATLYKERKEQINGLLGNVCCGVESSSFNLSRGVQSMRKKWTSRVKKNMQIERRIIMVIKHI